MLPLCLGFYDYIKCNTFKKPNKQRELLLYEYITVFFKAFFFNLPNIISSFPTAYMVREQFQIPVFKIHGAYQDNNTIIHQKNHT